MSKLNNILNEENDVLTSLADHKEVKEVSQTHDKYTISETSKKKIRDVHFKVTRRIYALIAVVAAVSFIAILLVGISYLPRFGGENSPTNNEIVDKYIGEGKIETGVTNFVSGMILDYRAFDTLGESFVLFTAVCSVFILLKKTKGEKEVESDNFTLTSDPILRSFASFLVPLIFMFGAYVILNGSISPGGGFSGGAIIGAGLILYSLAFGEEKTKKFFNIKTFKIITTLALLCYCVCKAYAFYTGANGYESIFEHLIHLQTAGNIFSGGLIFILNICVGLVVSCTMYGFYSLFKRGEI